MQIPEIGQIWIHHSGKEYAIDRVTINAETGHHDVVYYSLADFAYYTRSLAGFMGYGESHKLNFTLDPSRTMHRLRAQREVVAKAEQGDV